MKRSLALCVSALCALALRTAAPADPPAWWDHQDDSKDAVDGSGPPAAENYKLANLGQAKWFATLAHGAMRERLPGGAAFDLIQLFPPPPDPAPQSYIDAQFKPLNLGQLKFLAKPFYDRMLAGGYDTRAAIEQDVTSYLPGWSHPYPWDPSTPAGENFKPANLGQLKMVFSFDIDAMGQSHLGGDGFRPVQWTAHAGTGAQYPADEGSSLKKTAPQTAWDSDAISSTTMRSDGKLRFSVKDPSPTFPKALVIGLSAANPDSNYTSIDYGLFFQGTDPIQVFESGQGSQQTWPGPAASDVFEIRRSGNTIEFSRNGVVFHSLTATSTPPLMVDTSFLQKDGEIHKCEYSGFFAEDSDADNDGIVDWWEHQHGLDPNSTSDGDLDADGDGFSNLSEFVAGSDPTDVASHPGSAGVPFELLNPGQ